MANIVLKQRETELAIGWLTRGDGVVTLWEDFVSREDLYFAGEGFWYSKWVSSQSKRRYWTEDEFKGLYTGIPRNGRAVRKKIEIVVD